MFITLIFLVLPAKLRFFFFFGMEMTGMTKACPLMNKLEEMYTPFDSHVKHTCERHRGLVILL